MLRLVPQVKYKKSAHSLNSSFYIQKKTSKKVENQKKNHTNLQQFVLYREFQDLVYQTLDKVHEDLHGPQQAYQGQIQ